MALSKQKTKNRLETISTWSYYFSDMLRSVKAALRLKTDPDTCLQELQKKFFTERDKVRYNKHFFIKLHKAVLASKASSDNGEASKNFALEKLKQNSNIRKGYEDEFAVLSNWFNRAALKRLRATLNKEYPAPVGFYSNDMLKKYAALKVKCAATVITDIATANEGEVITVIDKNPAGFIANKISEYKKDPANQLRAATKLAAAVTKKLLADIKECDNQILQAKARQAEIESASAKFSWAGFRNYAYVKSVGWLYYFRLGFKSSSFRGHKCDARIKHFENHKRNLKKNLTDLKSADKNKAKSPTGKEKFIETTLSYATYCGVNEQVTKLELDAIRQKAHDMYAPKDVATKNDLERSLVNACEYGIASLLSDDVLNLINEQYDSRTEQHKHNMRRAIQLGHADVVKVFLDRRLLDILQKDQYGYLPLHLAVQSGHADVVKLLLGASENLPKNKHGATADLNHRAPHNSSKFGVTPMHLAILHDHIDIARMLLDRGANPHSRVNGYRSDRIRKLLSEAIKSSTNSEKTVEIAGSNGGGGNSADLFNSMICAIDNKNKTDLATLCARAKKQGNKELFRNINDTGLTLLLKAVIKGNIAMAAELLSYDSDIDAQDSDGNTPLMLASSAGNYDMVEFLLSRGANKDIQNGGTNALINARRYGHGDIELLLRNSNDGIFEASLAGGGGIGGGGGEGTFTPDDNDEYVTGLSKPSQSMQLPSAMPKRSNSGAAAEEDGDNNGVGISDALNIFTGGDDDDGDDGLTVNPSGSSAHSGSFLTTSSSVTQGSGREGGAAAEDSAGNSPSHGN